MQVKEGALRVAFARGVAKSRSQQTALSLSNAKVGAALITAAGFCFLSPLSFAETQTLPPINVTSYHCPAGSHFDSVNSDGTVVCAVDAAGGTVFDPIVVTGIRGGPSTQSRSDPNAPTGLDPQQDPCNAAGDPIIFSTGNEIEPETDFVSRGEMPLMLQRTYNHFWNYSGIFGKNWISNFDYSLAFDYDDSGNVTTVWSQRPDGRRIKFILASSGRWNEARAQPVAYLVLNTDGSYTLHSEDKTVETYNSRGNPIAILNEQGIGWTYLRSIGGRIDQIKHTSGRSIQFVWTQGPFNRQLIQVTDPAGNVYRYGYTNNVLSSVSMPGTPATTVTYQYENASDPSALTGKTVNGVRYATIAYGTDGRAISSELAGGVEKYAYTYTGATVWPAANPVSPPPTPDADWCGPNGQPCQMQLAATQQATQTQTQTQAIQQLTVVETNPLGKQTTYVFNDGKRVSTTGQASAHCSANYKEQTYDANGYDDLVSDFANNITDYDYSAAGNLTKVTEASGTPSARVTTYTWDTVNNRLTSATLVGDSKTDYTYTSNGRLASVTKTNLSANGVANQTHVTSYSYTTQANGMLATMTVDGPLLNDTVTYTYAATTGDLLTVKNSLNQTVTYSNYNAFGQPGRIVGANNDTTDYVYDPRGRVIAVKPTVNGVVQTYSTYFNPLGLVSMTITPDGQWLARTYDAAGRLTSEYMPETGGTYARKRYTLNTLSLPTRIDTERVSGVAMDGPPPTSSSALTAPATNATGGYTVSWTTVSGATSYQVDESANGGNWIPIQTSGAVSAAISGKSNGTFNYRVSACNSIGCGPYSGTASTVVTIPVPTLTGPATTQTLGNYTVTWTSVAAATSYQLQERVNGGTWTTIYTGSGLSMARSALPASDYGYQVKACTANGCGAFSAVRTISVQGKDGCPTCLAPSQPRGKSTNSKQTQIGGKKGGEA